MPFQFFDPTKPVSMTRRHLPHWDQEGATYFITWRTLDSIPQQIWSQWKRERSAWLQAHGIDSTVKDWRRHLEDLSEDQRRQFRKFSKLLEGEMDACHGECVLKRPRLSQIVAQSLTHFDSERYALGDFVVMPNHVHLLVGGMPRDVMLAQVESWKKWSAIKINETLGRKGRFWQDEHFDHLVRNGAAFEKFRNYIAANSVKANLSSGEFHYRRRPDETA